MPRSTATEFPRRTNAKSIHLPVGKTFDHVRGRQDHECRPRGSAARWCDGDRRRSRPSCCRQRSWSSGPTVMTGPWPIRSRTLRANRPTESAPLPVPPSTRATLPRTCAAGRSDARDVPSLILHCTKFLHAAFRRADRGSRIATLGFVPAAYLIDLPIFCSAGPDWHEACKAEATPSPLLAPCVLSRTEQATPPPWEERFRAPGGDVRCLRFTGPVPTGKEHSDEQAQFELDFGMEPGG